MNELQDWEAQQKIRFVWAQQDYQLLAVETALFDLLQKDEQSGYKLGQSAWNDLYNRFGYIEVLDAGDRLVRKGRCGMCDGALYTQPLNGFDYTNQAWVVDGKYQRCGHPETMNCGCFGRDHAGEPPAANAKIH